MERGFYNIDDEASGSQAKALAEVRDMGGQNTPEAHGGPSVTIVTAEPVPGGAVKFDGGKAPIYQGFLNRFPRAIMGVAMVSEYGQRKYGSYDGWEKVPDGLKRYTDAKARHMLNQSIEGPYDDGDSGLAHALQEAWGAMARAEMLIQKGAIEIRRGNEIVNGKPVLGTARAP